MRAGIVLATMLVLGMSLGMARGQQSATNLTTSFTNTTTLKEGVTANLHQPPSMEIRLTPPDTNSLEYLVGKTKVHVSGPAVRPLKAKGVGDFSRRILHLFSPFSDQQPNLPPGAEVSGPVSARAWSTIAGWSPGASAFPTEAHHDIPQIRLISVSTEKLPKEP